MPRQGRDDTVGNIVKRIASSYVYYEFTSWHEYLGRADFFPLCNVNVVLGRISIDELTALVDAPLDNDVSCIGHSPVPMSPVPVSPLFGSIRSRNHKKYT